MPFLIGEDPPAAPAATSPQRADTPTDTTNSEIPNLSTPRASPEVTGPPTSYRRGGRQTLRPPRPLRYTSRFSEVFAAEADRATARLQPVFELFNRLEISPTSSEAIHRSGYDENTLELLRSYESRFLTRSSSTRYRPIPEHTHRPSIYTGGIQEADEYTRAAIAWSSRPPSLDSGRPAVTEATHPAPQSNPETLSSSEAASVPPQPNSSYTSSSTTVSQNIMTSSTTSTATPPPHPFEKRVQAIEISKDDMNSLVMDFLISKGYPGTAARFAKEANVPAKMDTDTIKERVEVRDLICKEEILTAIEKISDIDPQLLDQDFKLHFALLRLQLVKLVRACMAKMPNDDEEFLIAQKFAEEHLGPRAPASPETLDDLENTMLLLMYQVDKVPEKLKYILKPELREEVAERVNQALLERMGESTHSKLADIVRLRVWAENKARESKIDLPEHLDIGLDQPSTSHNGHNGAIDGVSHVNGDAEPMVS